MKVYVLQHVHSHGPTNEEIKMIGVYSSEQAAQRTVDRLRGALGFRDAPDGFVVDCYEVDTDHWVEGYETVGISSAEGPVPSLRERLTDWTDWDHAAFALGCSLGLFSTNATTFDVKHVFWTDNEIGSGLHDLLLVLARLGFLESREEPDEQFRWNSESRQD
jgi:hypothetical protein